MLFLTVLPLALANEPPAPVEDPEPLAQVEQLETTAGEILSTQADVLATLTAMVEAQKLTGLEVAPESPEDSGAPVTTDAGVGPAPEPN